MSKQKSLWLAAGLLITFLLWTLAICFVDVSAIGPMKSTVGFAKLNSFVHNITGVHMSLYTITDWLGLVPVLFMVGFGILGLVQWIKRKRLLKVDCSILILGGFYIVITGIYVFFEIFVFNYRPILINGYLEASYPSSTTMLVMCVMLTSITELNTRIKNYTLKRCISFAITIFTVFMIVVRLISGVHWFSDIVGGALLSSGLVMIHYSIISWGERNG